MEHEIEQLPLRPNGMRFEKFDNFWSSVSKITVGKQTPIETQLFLIAAMKKYQ